MIAVDTSARRIAQAYERWGKGINPAALNFGDCFAYEVAKEHGGPLLFVGNDFAGTDIEGVLWVPYSVRGTPLVGTPASQPSGAEI
jgi:uncharacterized protein with PIN domain